MRLLASALAAGCRGRLVGPDVEVDGATNDSRTVRPGQLFVPVVAERDGHGFVAGALAAGAVAYLSSRPAQGGTAIEVPDTGRALLLCGHVARAALPDRVVGITGSVGKTSVKDLTAAALGAAMPTAASERSFNNELGVPITLLGAPDGTEAVVLEMGARGIGHVRLLCEVGRPTVGVVTAVAAVHTEVFGTIDDVARGKGELVEALPADGVAVLNADDRRVAAMASRTGARVLRYGLEAADVDLAAEGVRLDDGLRPRFTLRTPWGSSEVRLAVAGAHMAANALAAAGAALACGAPLAAVAEGLGRAALSPWRMELHRTGSGAVVLNDAYNANPTSVGAALRSLVALPGGGRRVAVLGAMAELADEADAHAEVAALVRSLGVELVAVGTPLYGIDPVVDPVAAVGPLGAGDAVLVKASRVAGLERVAEALLRA